MAYHEFGIMENNPKDDKRYDEYDPKKYKCIKINDDFIEPLLPEFKDILCYWHTLKLPNRNLAYCGITLIPPESIDLFITIFMKQYESEFKEIILLFQQAKKGDKYIIHFGI